MSQGTFSFRGIRSSTDFLTQYMEEDWRAGIALLEANIDTPLAFLSSLAKTEKANSPIYDWFSEREYFGVLTITGKYTDPALTTPYNPANQGQCVEAGKFLYFKMSEDDAKRIEANHIVRLSDNNLRVDLQGDVVSVTLAGANSFVAVKLLQTDTYVAGGTLAAANVMIDLGKAAPEYDTWGVPMMRDPKFFQNYTQIFHKSIGVTGTQMATSNYRIGDPYTRAKEQALHDMNMALERAFIFGRPSVGLGSNGMPRRTTAGLLWFIDEYASANRDDYRTSAHVTAETTWLNGGLEWLEGRLTELFKWGSDTRMGICGNGTIAAINKLIKEEVQYNIYHGEKAYGINFSILETPFGVLALHRHRLLTHVPADNHRMIIIEPGNLGIKDLRPLAYKTDLTKELGSAVAVDGIKEGFIAECGTLIDHPQTMADLRGFGFDRDA